MVMSDIDKNEIESLRAVTDSLDISFNLATLQGIDKLRYELYLLEKEKSNLQDRLNSIQLKIENKVNEIENNNLKLEF